MTNHYTTATITLDSADTFVLSLNCSLKWYDTPPYTKQTTKVFDNRLQVFAYIDSLQPDSDTINRVRVYDMTTTPPTTYFRTIKSEVTV